MISLCAATKITQPIWSTKCIPRGISNKQLYLQSSTNRQVKNFLKYLIAEHFLFVNSKLNKRSNTLDQRQIEKANKLYSNNVFLIQSNHAPKEIPFDR